MGRINFGYILRRLRHDRDETLEQVSEATGLSVAMLSRVERGERLPSPDSVEALARHFELPVDYLMSETIANRMVNRYGEESTNRAAEHLSREPIDFGLPAGETGQEEDAEESGAAGGPGAPSRARGSRPRSYGPFQERDIRAAFGSPRQRPEAPGSAQTPPPAPGGVPAPPPGAGGGAGRAPAPPPAPGGAPAYPTDETALSEEQLFAQPLRLGLIAPTPAPSAQIAAAQPRAPRNGAEIDPATERVLRAAREATEAAAFLVMREAPSLSREARLELTDRIMSLAGQAIDVLRMLASDPDKGVRAAAARALERLSRS